MASCVLAQMHNMPSFAQLIANARQEYLQLTSGETSISTQNSPSETSSARIYDMQGRQLNDTSTPKGVYIKGNKKVIGKF